MQKKLWTVFTDYVYVLTSPSCLPRNNPNFAPKRQPRPSSSRLSSAVAKVCRHRIVRSLTLVIRRQPAFSKGNSHPVFCHISFSNDKQFRSKFFEESFFCVPNYIIISLQVTFPRTRKTSLTRIYSNCLQSFIPE